MTERSEVQEARSAFRRDVAIRSPVRPTGAPVTGATRSSSRTVGPGHVAWTAGALGAIWLAVLVIGLFSPDLGFGSEQQHQPVAAVLACFRGALTTVVW